MTLKNLSPGFGFFDKRGDNGITKENFFLLKEIMFLNDSQQSEYFECIDFVK